MRRFAWRSLLTACGLLLSAGCAQQWVAPADPLAGFFERPDVTAGTPARPKAQLRQEEGIELCSTLPLEEQRRILAELVALRKNITAQLELPHSRRLIRVVLFASHDDFAAYLSAQPGHLPDRRALFIERAGELTVLAHGNERLTEDLRHELTHGVVHAVVADLPLWLDEGLAEYFENPADAQGFNKQHAEDLVDALGKGAWRPDLPRLEQLAGLDAFGQAEYAESWAWTHYLLNTSAANRGLLLNVLKYRRSPGTPPIKLSPTLLPHSGEMIEHVKRLAKK